MLCGSQPDMIQRALDKQVACLILCQTDVEPAWLENAGKTCVISTPLDASRVHRLIYQATPIARPCATEGLISFQLDDYIDDVREVVLKSRYRCYPVLDENEKVVGTLSRYHLLKPRRKRVVLVDHNELSQTVPGIRRRSWASSTITVWRTSRPGSPSPSATSRWAAPTPSSPPCIRSTASRRRPTWQV